MSDLLSPILYVMENEVDAFWCFVAFIEQMVRLQSREKLMFFLKKVTLRKRCNIHLFLMDVPHQINMNGPFNSEVKETEQLRNACTILKLIRHVVQMPGLEIVLCFKSYLKIVNSGGLLPWCFPKIIVASPEILVLLFPIRLTMHTVHHMHKGIFSVVYQGRNIRGWKGEIIVNWGR